MEEFEASVPSTDSQEKWNRGERSTMSDTEVQVAESYEEDPVHANGTERVS